MLARSARDRRAPSRSLLSAYRVCVPRARACLCPGGGVRRHRAPSRAAARSGRSVCCCRRDDGIACASGAVVDGASRAGRRRDVSQPAVGHVPRDGRARGRKGRVDGRHDRGSGSRGSRDALLVSGGEVRSRGPRSRRPRHDVRRPHAPGPAGIGQFVGPARHGRALRHRRSHGRGRPDDRGVRPRG